MGRDPCNTSGAPAPYFPADDECGCGAERGAAGGGGGRNGNGTARGKRKRGRASLAVTCGNRDLV